jgi:hypothetical protein
MKIHINAFKVSLITNKGPYGVLALFDKGLNVIRAENTSGKSALINGMLYALGIEILVGKRGIEATKPILRSSGDYDGQQFNILESFVEIEISNGFGEIITIRRYITGGHKDPRLIEVVRGPVVTGETGNQNFVESFFVGIEGAAQRERGFHHFLAEFLDLELPLVKRFQGEDVPLYIECIAPLMFIEQIRGWAGIQMAIPQSFGIRNVAKLAIEYTLSLDVIENEKRRIQISEEAIIIRQDWGALKELLTQIASEANGRLMNVPSGPVADMTDKPWIAISSDDKGLITLDDYLFRKRAMLIALSSEQKTEVTGNKELEEKLETYENTLVVLQAELSQLRSDMFAEENELRTLLDRLEFIKADIQRNRDIKRLMDFGEDTGLALVHDRCPTCNQKIQDSLIPTESAVMGVEDNINFLRTEAGAVELLVSSTEERLALFQTLKAKKSQDMADLRLIIRDLRSDLLGQRDLSVAAIREQIHLQEQISRIEKLRDEFEEQLDRIKGLVARWQENRAKYSELPSNYFSDKDKDKLNALSKRFATNIQAFGYRSTDVSRLRISEDNYRPICDDFEIAFEASASDNIRLIWAYTLALVQISLSHGGKHWGILVYDEPEQQKMKEASSDALYAEIAKMPPEDLQVIIATSAPEDVTRRRLDNLPHWNLLEFGDKVIRPM